MYGRAKFFRIDYPITVQDIDKKIKNVTKKIKRVPDKNIMTEKISLSRKFYNKRKIGENYIFGMEMEWQITVKKGMPYQTTQDLLDFLFFTKEKILVVLGSDDVVAGAVKEVAETLYGDIHNIKPFGHVTFEKNSLVNIINKLKQDDPDSWCDEHNAYHGALKYQERKTKTNFSLGEGNCVLDDPEAQKEIDNATSISPKYRFTKCPKFNGISYDLPKTLRFNGMKGVVSISTKQNFENWHKFISNFLLQHLELVYD